MTLNGSIAYDFVNDDPPTILVCNRIFRGPQNGETWFIEWTDAEPFDCYIFANGDVLPVPLCNVLTKWGCRKTLLKHFTKTLSFEVLHKVKEPCKPLAIFMDRPHNSVHPCCLFTHETFLLLSSAGLSWRRIHVNVLETLTKTSSQAFSWMSR